MPRPFAKTALLSAAASCALCLPASGGKYMKSMSVGPATHSFGGPVIEVESDGESWTRIKEGSHVLKVKVDIAAGSGWRVMNAYVGVPNADFGGTDQTSDAVRRLGGGKKVKSIKRTETHTFHTDDLVFDRQAILGACNGGDHPATQERTVFTDIGVGIKAYFQTRRDARRLQQAGPDEGRSETAHARVPITVRCLAGPSHSKGLPKPISVDIRVKQTGETCPKDTEVTAYIDYDKPMTTRFRIIHNGTEPKSEPIEIKARKVSFAGKTWYRVERLERYKLDPGEHTFQIKVMGGGLSPTKTVTVDCPAFKATSMWLTLDKSAKATCPKNVDAKVRINANGPGSVLTKIKNQAGAVMAIESIKVVRDGNQYVGHLTKSFDMSAIDAMLIAEDVNDTATNSGWQALKVTCLDVLSGTLQQRGFTASACKGEAALSIRASQAGKIPYRLECTGGRAWQGSVQAHETGPDTFIGVEVVKFDVSNNELVRCALRTSQPLPYKLLAGAKRTYACHQTSGVSGSDAIVSEPRDEPHQAQGGAVVIDAGPQVSCEGGVVNNDKCVCARTHTSIAHGRNAFRCVRTAIVDPVRPDPVKPDRVAPDRGGTIVDATGGDSKPTRQDAEADRRRLEALKRRQEAKRRAEAAARKKAAQEAAAKRKREAAKTAAAAAKRKRLAAQKAAEAKRKREAAKQAAAARKRPNAVAR